MKHNLDVYTGIAQMIDRAHILSKTEASGLSDWDHKPFLEKVTRIVPGIIYVFNQQSQSNEYSNHSLGESLGYSVDEIQAMGATFMPTLCHPEDLERVFEHFDVIKKLSDGAVAEIEYRMKHRDGGWVWLLSHDTVFERDKTGSVLRHIGVATDVTAQKEAEAKVAREKQAADDANSELRSFAYSISHDLKSPSVTLALLLSEMESSLGSNLDDDMTELLASSRKTVTRMQTLIEDVLHYTRVIGDEQISDVVDLSEIVSDVLDDLRAEISATSASIDADVLPQVTGSKTQLRVLMQNLITNAMRYQPPGNAPKISISSTQHGRQNWATISVSDNGIGIDPSKQEQIFQMFARLHTEHEYAGTGLGLATCRRIATNHGGSITVDSNPGEGSTFSVILPTLASE